LNAAARVALYLSKKDFPIDSQAPELYIPMTKQTLNRDGMVTSVEFSCGVRSQDGRPR
jgi:hypothetical protein